MLTVSNTNTALHTELRYTSLFTKLRALVGAATSIMKPSNFPVVVYSLYFDHNI